MLDPEEWLGTNMAIHGSQQTTAIKPKAPSASMDPLIGQLGHIRPEEGAQ
jgi:hypothetical protein